MSLASRLDALASPRILVLGDLILDRYTFGNAERVSPEAPVLILRSDDQDVRLGGAASVAILLRALGADVTLAGVVGNDSAGRMLQTLVHDAGIDGSLFGIDPGRRTTTKERFVGRTGNRSAGSGNQLLRVDSESRQPIDDAIEADLLCAISSRLAEFDAILISDYAKGFCAPRLLQAVIGQARAQGMPVLVDPARNADYSRYRRATLVKPNRVEAELASGCRVTTPQEALHAAQRLCRRYEFEATLITLDCEGMALVHDDDSHELFAAEPRAVCDVTGAGDMVLATLGLCLARQASGASRTLSVVSRNRRRMASAPTDCGPSTTDQPATDHGQLTTDRSKSEIPALSLPDAIRVANVAAGLQVERLGVAPVTRAELRAALLPPAVHSGPDAIAAGRQGDKEGGRQGGELGGPDARNVSGTLRVPSAAASDRPPTKDQSIPQSEFRIPNFEKSEIRNPKSKISSKLTTLPAMAELAAEYRLAGKTTVFTNGCFDLLHIGHVTCLAQAAALGDVLIVALNSDASVRRLKGRRAASVDSRPLSVADRRRKVPDTTDDGPPTTDRLATDDGRLTTDQPAIDNCQLTTDKSLRPIIPEQQRATLLAALECVDHVLIFDDDAPHRLLEQIRPNVLVKGGTTADIVGREIVESYGGRVCHVGAVPAISTTQIIAAVRVE